MICAGGGAEEILSNIKYVIYSVQLIKMSDTKDGSQNWVLFAHFYIPLLGLKGLGKTLVH